MFLSLCLSLSLSPIDIIRCCMCACSPCLVLSDPKITNAEITICLTKRHSARQFWLTSCLLRDKKVNFDKGARKSRWKRRRIALGFRRWILNWFGIGSLFWRRLSSMIIQVRIHRCFLGLRASHSTTMPSQDDRSERKLMGTNWLPVRGTRQILNSYAYLLEYGTSS